MQPAHRNMPLNTHQDLIQPLIDVAINVRDEEAGIVARRAINGSQQAQGDEVRRDTCSCLNESYSCTQIAKITCGGIIVAGLITIMLLGDLGIIPGSQNYIGH